ncbi:MAG: hypothetical protein OSB00_11145 [Sphingomonas bacterium]|nr:hypothetical protein [Sphingomonas bacterium]
MAHMISSPANHRIMPPTAPGTPLCVVAMAALLLTLVPTVETTAILAALATCAAIVAAIERRHAAMLIATGVAVALGPVGFLITPVAIGLAAEGRRWRPLSLAILLAVATFFADGSWVTEPSVPTLFAFTARWPDLFSLITASGCAVATWIAAAASTARMNRAALLRLSAISLVFGPLFIALPLASLMLPALLLICWRVPVRSALAAANDNQVVRSTIRLAA